MHWWLIVFSSLRPVNLIIYKSYKWKCIQLQIPFNKNLIAWSWSYFRNINLILSLQLSPYCSDLSHALSRDIMKLTLSCVWFWNHSVYLLIRLWHGTRSGAPLSAAWGPDKSCLGWSCQQGEEVWGSTQGLALRNDAISACATVSPLPPHKLDPAEQVTVDSAGDRWVLTHTHIYTHMHTCHHTFKYGYCRDGDGDGGF